MQRNSLSYKKELFLQAHRLELTNNLDNTVQEKKQVFYLLLELIRSPNHTMVPNLLNHKNNLYKDLNTVLVKILLQNK